MGYICLSCGCDNDFKADQSYTEYGTERIYFDGEGEIQDYGDRDSSDSDTGDWNDIKCYECNSSDVSNLDEEEREEVRKSFPDRNYGDGKSRVTPAQWKDRF